jgi:flagellar FliJ protein
MTAFSSLHTLIDLATDARDSAAVQLGRLRQTRQQSRQQLDALLAYREEYRTRMEAALADGVSMASLDNYRRFLASLDRAIVGQRAALADNDARVAGGKRHWQDRQRRLQSFDTLAKRRFDAHARIEAKREQRLSDEYAQRIHSHGKRCSS